MLGFGNGEVFLSLLWFTLFFIWIWLLIIVFSDIFRSHDIGGFAKFLWIAFIIIMPYLGIFVYLIARGHKMSEHAVTDAQAQDAAFRNYVRSAAASPADDLTKLEDLHNRGVLSDEEFQRAKQKALAS
jgi:hypothetical protein